MITYKEFKKNKQEELVEKWNTKYPNGQFVLQRIIIYSDRRFYMHHNVVRHSTQSRPIGGIHCWVDASSDLVYFEDTQWSSFGTCNLFDNYDSFIKACLKKNVPTILIDEFNKQFKATGSV